MMDLSEILQVLGCKKPFKKDGSFTKTGSEKYSELIKILYSVAILAESNNIDTIIKKLDAISNE